MSKRDELKRKKKTEKIKRGKWRSKNWERRES